VNRSKILRSLYVILLGNPALDEKQDAPMKTRFKMWYRLVGAAVEHAAQCAAWLDPDRDHMPDQALDFGTLFLDQEGDDEDATSLAEALHSLEKAMADADAAMGRLAQPFKAADVADAINATSIKADALTVRGFLFPNQPSGTAVTAKAVGKRLKAHIGEPVRHGREALVLKAYMDKHDKTLKFHVAVIE
jgi:hypothetical protein